MNSTLTVAQKYHLYESSVQNYRNDIAFILEQFTNLFHKQPISLREDFGGTGAMACEWVRNNPDRVARSIDLDDEPIAYGKENHFSTLSPIAKKNMHYIKGNVLDRYPFSSDISVAFNFSYCIFKKRAELLNYFKLALSGLNDSGLFFLDLFGGTEARQALIEETEHDNHTYFWDCDKYNPLTDECTYYIHFKTHQDQLRHEKVFEYNWRLWSPSEIKDILLEAGFSKVEIFWEGEEEDGSGDGNFSPAKDVENCESWVVYIMAVK